MVSPAGAAAGAASGRGLGTPPGIFGGNVAPGGAAAAGPPPPPSLPTDVQQQRRQVLVTGLPRGLSETDVRLLFKVCGPLTSVTKVPDQVCC
jgi:hypothetical protein